MVIRTRLYRHSVLEASDFPAAEVSDHLDEPGTFVWLDLEEPRLEDFDLLVEEFQLHPLAVEDATKPHQRPKLELYPHHMFLVLYALDYRGGALQSSEVNVFVGERFLITVRKDKGWSVDPITRRWDHADDDLQKEGAGFFLYEVLDLVVDGYMAISDSLEERVEDLEEELFRQDAREDLQQEIFDARKQLITFRRAAVPLVDVVGALAHKESAFFTDNMKPYFQDVQDHVIRSRDAVEAMRDTLSNALEVYLAYSSHRLNDIMRKVTSWAAILGAATTIAGIYGMNFRLVPADQTLFGFWFALGLIFVSCLGLYLYFKTRDWI